MTGEHRPYAPPASELRPSSPGAPPASFATFRDGGTRAIAAIVGLVASPIVSTIGMILSPVLEDEGDPSAGMLAVLLSFALLAVGIAIGTIVAFCMWFHRAIANLYALGLGSPRFTPAWAVGTFFIPVLNLFRPYQAAKEAWNHTDAVLAGDVGRYSVARSSGVVALWWGLWLVSNLLSSAVMQQELRAGTANRTLEWVSLVCDFASAAAAIAFVALLTRRQREAAARLSAQG